MASSGVPRVRVARLGALPLLVRLPSLRFQVLLVVLWELRRNRVVISGLPRREQTKLDTSYPGRNRSLSVARAKTARATARVRPYNIRDPLVENRPGNNACIETIISCTLQYCSVSPWAKEAGAYPRSFGEGNSFERRGGGS